MDDLGPDVGLPGHPVVIPRARKDGRRVVARYTAIWYLDPVYRKARGEGHSPAVSGYTLTRKCHGSKPAFCGGPFTIAEIRDEILRLEEADEVDDLFTEVESEH
jgi:hypothetical protein